MIFTSRGALLIDELLGSVCVCVRKRGEEEQKAGILPEVMNREELESLVIH